jgi:selenium-binding protein 1
MHLLVSNNIRQYDITDRFNPKLVGQVFVGGSIQKGGSVTIVEGQEQQLVEVPTVQGVKLQGGPQMIQLSLDGKRLYVTNSLFSNWDKQFYPNLESHGSQLFRLNVNLAGGLEIDRDFLIDFGKIEDGPYLAHETRYPGGDCTSDIWL